MNPKMREFENDTFLHNELARIVANHQVRSVCETGCEFGGSANAFSKMPPVQLVLTIDTVRKVADDELLPNVSFMLGDSRKMLSKAIQEAQRHPALRSHPILFFLDAHSSIETDECPLRGELQAILEAKLPVPPVLVIHDCKVPGRDFGFDTYRDGPICWEWVSDLIVRLYPGGYEKHYNENASGSKRGCLFVEPIAWNPESRWKPSPEEEQRMAE